MEISSLEQQIDLKVGKLTSYRQYIFFLSSQFFSIFGSSVVSFLIILWITFETGSAILLSLSSFFYLLPQIIVTLFSGVLSDRYNKKILIFLSDFSQALITLWLFFSFAFGSQILLVIILIISSLRSIFQAIQIPVVKSLIPLMVPKEKISRVNGLNYFINSFTLIIAPLVATILLSFFSIDQVLLLDLITFLLSIIPLAMIKFPNVENRTSNIKKSFYWEFKAGFKAISRVKGLKSLIFLAMCNVLIKYPFTILFPLFLSINHGGNEFHLAIYIAFINTGFLLGSVVTFLKKRWKHEIGIISLGLIFYYLMYIFITFSPSGAFLIIWILALSANSLFPLIDSLYYTLMQTNIPKDIIGRVIAIDWSLSLIISPIGIILSGVLSSYLGIIPIFLICAILGIIVTILFWFFSNLKRLNYNEVDVIKK